jgi:hypothetical protein
VEVVVEVLVVEVLVVEVLVVVVTCRNRHQKMMETKPGERLLLWKPGNQRWLAGKSPN